MKQIPNYADQRTLGQCIYCGGRPETREHVPPKVFLDEPFPENLPVVEACGECNVGFSTHEEYLACLIDCVISGSVDPDRVQREKIGRILAKRPSLATRIDAARSDDGEGSVFSVEQDRVRMVVEKIARGHALYEINELLGAPTKVCALPFASYTEPQRSAFEDVAHSAVGICPEVGSRSMQRFLVVYDSAYNAWIEVQPDRYRYAVTQSRGVSVHMVFSEYLACQVSWE